MFDQKDAGLDRYSSGYGTAAGHQEMPDAPRPPCLTGALETAYQTRDFLKTLADGAEGLVERLCGSPPSASGSTGDGGKPQRTPGIVHDVITVQMEVLTQTKRLEQALSQIARMIG